jgi:peptide/nickel transport system substrate-binding protein
MNDDEIKRAGFSRRDMMRVLAAGGMLATGAGGMLAGATSAFADTPKKGGKIRAAYDSSSTADTLDPAKGSTGADYIRFFMFYSGLTQFDSSLTPQPALAESFTTSDAKVWTLKLRKGVTFHDGKPLTPADVAYSLTRHKNPATASKVKSVADQFDEVKASGPDEVQITLTTPNADLPAILATPQLVIIKDGTTDFSTAVGTGPYKLKTFKPGVSTVGARNDNYWRPGKPYLDEVELIGIGDDSARVNALLSGDVHLISAVDPRATQRVASTPGYAIKETKSGLYTDLIMRRDNPLTGNPDFVQGMKYLFDREQIRTAVFRGYAVIGNDQPIPPGHRYYFAGFPQRPYDPDKAKFHLQNLGRQRFDRNGRDDAIVGAEDRCQPDREPRAARRLLVEPLDEASARLRQHQPAAERGRAVHPVLQVGCPVERIRLEESAIRPVAAGSTRRNRRSQAQADVR